ncbi:hypothetical protein ACFORL_10230 [Legionella dresdenensis]|uniref:Uncharacterized protein n=1 Tax=Legionella dresdenensis TaxID=450200 RepID=A0ABV8CH79_9GAMM
MFDFLRLVIVVFGFLIIKLYRRQSENNPLITEAAQEARETNNNTRHPMAALHDNSQRESLSDVTRDSLEDIIINEPEPRPARGPVIPSRREDDGLSCEFSGWRW